MTHNILADILCKFLILNEEKKLRIGKNSVFCGHR